MFWIPVLALAGMLLSGLMVGICLGMTGVIFLYFFGGGATALQSAVIGVWNLLYNFSLSALPLYLLLAELFVVTGLASRSYTAIAPLFERFPGKLLLSNVVIDAMFGAVVGTSMATAATVGGIAYPELSKRGYNRRTLVGNLAGAGTLGSFVPPSLGLIIYGSWVQISVGSCFVASLFPALVTIGLFMIYVMVHAKIQPDIAPSAGEVTPLARALIGTIGVWPLLILMFCILGTIYLGLATPTEAAGLGILGAIILSIPFRMVSFKKIYSALLSAVSICGMVFFIMVGASIFSISVSVIGLPRYVILSVQELGLAPIVVVLFVYVLYLILGCFFDFVSMLLMTLPFTFPLMMSIGADPLWFAIVLVITGEMGLITPPVGMNLYVLQGVTRGEVSLGEVARGSIPYFLMLGVSLGLITIFPQLCTWLPTQMK